MLKPIFQIRSRFPLFPPPSSSSSLNSFYNKSQCFSQWQSEMPQKARGHKALSRSRGVTHVSPAPATEVGTRVLYGLRRVSHRTVYGDGARWRGGAAAWGWGRGGGGPGGTSVLGARAGGDRPTAAEASGSETQPAPGDSVGAGGPPPLPPSPALSHTQPQAPGEAADAAPGPRLPQTAVRSGPERPNPVQLNPTSGHLHFKRDLLIQMNLSTTKRLSRASARTPACLVFQWRGAS